MKALAALGREHILFRILTTFVADCKSCINSAQSVLWYRRTIFAVRTMAAVLKSAEPCGAIKFQNFKAGRTKLPWREILKVSPRANFKSGVATLKF